MRTMTGADISARVDLDVAEQLDALAKRLRRSRSQCIALAVEAFVEAERARSGEPIALHGTEVRVLR